MKFLKAFLVMGVLFSGIASRADVVQAQPDIFLCYIDPKIDCITDSNSKCTIAGSWVIRLRLMNISKGGTTIGLDTLVGTVADRSKYLEDAGMQNAVKLLLAEATVLRDKGVCTAIIEIMNDKAYNVKTLE